MGLAITAEQVGLMFFLMLLGLFAAKRGWLGSEAQVGLTNILVYFVTPCVIIQAFDRPYSPDQLMDLGLVALIDVAAFTVVILGIHLATRRLADLDRRRALRYATVYSNAGFLTLPLAQALLGDNGVFFVAIYVVIFNIFVWTHGIGLFPGGSGNVARRLLQTPAIPAVVVGLVIFLTSFHLPTIVATGLGYLANINAPASMLVVGASLAGISWRASVTDRWTWLGVAIRNVVVPLLGVLVLWPIPLPNAVKLTILIPLSAPIAAYLVMFSVMRGVDTKYPARLVLLSTLVALVSLPATLALAGWLW